MTAKSKFSLPLAALATLVAATSLNAQANQPEKAAGRYTMHKSDDGFVRLDTETGAVTLCQKADGAWGCKSITGAESGSTDEIARLTRENADLNAEIKRLDELLGLRGNRERNAQAPKDFKLPTEQEVDQALNYFERMIKKFQDRLKRFERKSEQQPERQL